MWTVRVVQTTSIAHESRVWEWRARNILSSKQHRLGITICNVCARHRMCLLFIHHKQRELPKLSPCRKFSCSMSDDYVRWSTCHHDDLSAQTVSYCVITTIMVTLNVCWANARGFAVVSEFTCSSFPWSLDHVTLARLRPILVTNAYKQMNLNCFLSPSAGIGCCFGTAHESEDANTDSHDVEMKQLLLSPIAR